jgi:hypothetical protein
MCLNIKIVIWKGTQRAILYYRKTAFLCYVLKATGRGVVCPCRAWLLRPLGYLHQGKGKNLQTLMFINGRGCVIYVVDQWNRKIIEHSETVIVWEEQIFDQINNPSSIHFNRQQSEYCTSIQHSQHETAVLAQAIIWTQASLTTGSGAVALIHFQHNSNLRILHRCMVSEIEILKLLYFTFNLLLHFTFFRLLYKTDTN